MALPTAPDMQPFNFLAGLQQAPARAPIEVSHKKPGKFVNTLGRILDAVATAGGATPGYKTNVLDAQKKAEADAVRMAAQRLAANPDDQEAFTFLAAREQKKAVEFRDALRPQAELKEAGGRLYRVEPDRQSAKALTEATAGGGIPSQIQIARAMADPNTPPLEREWLGRQIDPAVYQRDAAGNLIAVPKLGAPSNDLNTIWARMIQQESGGRQTDAQGRPLTSSAGAIGIAQVMPGTAPEAAALAGLPFDENRYRTDPDYNQAIGRAYFNQQVRTFGDPARAAAAYNAGPEAVRRAVQQGGENWLSLLPAETQNYVARVAGQGGARVVAANKGFRPGTQNGLPGQFGPDGRFYPDLAPKGATKKQDRRAGDPARVVQLATEARRILQEAARGGYVQKMRDFAGRVVGESTESSRAAAQLSQLAAAMILNMPRLEGPQSDKDVALYKEQAAQVGNTELPVDDRLAALNIMIATLDKYGLANPAAPPPPDVGATVKGYIFLGGDPSNPQSWRKASR